MYKLKIHYHAQYIDLIKLSKDYDFFKTKLEEKILPKIPALNGRNYILTIQVKDEETAIRNSEEYHKLYDKLKDLKEKQYIANIKEDIEIIQEQNIQPEIQVNNYQDNQNQYSETYSNNPSNSEDFQLQNIPVYNNQFNEFQLLKDDTIIGETCREQLLKSINKRLPELWKNIKTEIKEVKLKEEEKDFDLKAGQIEKFKNLGEHTGIYCNNCCENLCESKAENLTLTPIKGPRFLCTECGCNLCFTCECLQNHDKTHSFLKINKKIDSQYEKGYNSMFMHKNIILPQSIKIDQQLTYSITVFNNGDKEWKADNYGKFFIFSIGDGEGFLYGPKVVCDKVIKRKECWKTDICIYCKKKGNYVSKWRMFNHVGIPFGEILYIHLTVE